METYPLPHARHGDTLSSKDVFLRHNTRKKDGKVHRYWSVVENRRLRAGHTIQRTVLYLGEINDTQQAAWRKSLGRELVLPRYTQPEPEHRLVLEKLGWELPPQPPPRIRSAQVPATANAKETKSKM